MNNYILNKQTLFNQHTRCFDAAYWSNVVAKQKKRCKLKKFLYFGWNRRQWMW